jgi:hypothetical protein
MSEPAARGQVRVPTTRHREDLVRKLIAAATQLFPGGGAITGLLDAFIATQSEKDLEIWYALISATINEQGDLIDQHSKEIAHLKEALQRLIAVGTLIDSKIDHRAAADAGQLTFFRTGMLGSLEKIASGDADEADQEALARLLDGTQTEVTEIIERLTSARDILSGKLGGLDLAHRIDQVIYGKVGKMGIRARIRDIIARDLSDPSLASLAQAVCSDIKGFNADVMELARSVQA